jgi:hypothetical protein
MKICRRMDTARLREMVSSFVQVSDADMATLTGIMLSPRYGFDDTDDMGWHDWARLIDLAFSDAIKAAAERHVSALDGEPEPASRGDAFHWERGSLPEVQGWNLDDPTDQHLVRVALAERIDAEIESR